MKENRESDRSGNKASSAFHASRIIDGSAARAMTYEVSFCHGEEQGDDVIPSADRRRTDEMQYWG